MKRLLQNRDSILLLSLAAGLLLPQGIRWTEQLVLPGLGLMMTLTCMGIPPGIFRHPRALIHSFLLGIILTFPVLGGLVFILATFLIDDPAVKNGLYIIAVVPPGIAVVPFTYYLRGNITLSLAGMVGGYVAALVVAPAAGLLLFGSRLIDPVKLFLTVAELIVLPVVLSRLAIKTGIAHRLEQFRSFIVNWAFFVVVYTIVGLNRSVFFEDPLSLMPIALIMVASSFCLALAVQFLGRLLRIRQEELVSVILLATVKNYGLAGGLALTFFEQKAAVPAAVASVVLILFFICLGFVEKKRLRPGRQGEDTAFRSTNRETRTITP